MVCKSLFSVMVNASMMKPCGLLSLRVALSNRHEVTRLRTVRLLSRTINSSFVITDSFHGTVFSIIFEKPFRCVVNERRGGVRFADLLKMRIVVKINVRFTLKIYPTS